MKNPFAFKVCDFVRIIGTLDLDLNSIGFYRDGIYCQNNFELKNGYVGQIISLDKGSKQFKSAPYMILEFQIGLGITRVVVNSEQGLDVATELEHTNQFEDLKLRLDVMEEMFTVLTQKVQDLDSWRESTFR